MQFNDNHLQSFSSLILEQYRKKIYINNIIQAFSSQLQSLEQAFKDIYYYRWVTTATHQTLDKNGEMFLVDRDYASDDVYRSNILIKIIINNGGGTPEDIKNAVTLRYNSVEVIYNEDEVAQFRITIIGGLEPTSVDIKALLDAIKPAGVRYDVEYVVSQKNCLIMNDITLESFDLEVTEEYIAIGELVTNDGSNLGVISENDVIYKRSSPLTDYNEFLEEDEGLCFFAEII